MDFGSVTSSQAHSSREERVCQRELECCFELLDQCVTTHLSYLGDNIRLAMERSMPRHHDKSWLKAGKGLSDVLRRIQFIVVTTPLIAKTETEPLEGSEALLCAEIELAHIRPAWFEVVRDTARRYPQHQADRTPHPPSSVAHRSK